MSEGHKLELPSEDYGPSNWGRWGSDDQRGTLNHLTPEHTTSAARLVTRGEVIPLGMDSGDSWPVFGERNAPWHHLRYRKGDITGFADDLLVLNSHTGTHIDGLGHSFLFGEQYNGVLVDDNVSSFGLVRNSIASVRGVATRGVMLDVAKLCGQPVLDQGFVISPALLEECESAQGVAVGRGDACLVRTGWSREVRKSLLSGERAQFEQPGLSVAVAEWFYEREVCLLGADNAAVDVLPGEPGVRPFGLHPRIIARQGGYLVEYLDLEELSTRNVKEFFFVLAPLLLSGGTGSPVNPLAIV